MSVPMKVCKNCQQEFPATPEYFHRAKHDQYGVHRHCKKCRNAIRKAQRASSPELRRKNRERVKCWYRENHMRALANKREYSRKHSAEAVQRVRQWRRDNPERYREQNRLCGQRWAKAHPEKTRTFVHNYQARKRDAPGKFTADDIQALYETQNGLCHYCGTPLNGVYDIDHAIPLSRNGTNYSDNLVLACPFCNRSKGDRLPHEWNPIAM